jgi:DNA-binding protein HU-beta
VNKAELISNIAEQAGLTKKDAEAALNAFITSVEDVLKEGGKVQLVGFGTFEVRERKARTGRNPRNPEQEIKIPASLAPVFKAGKSLKERVNK